MTANCAQTTCVNDQVGFLKIYFFLLAYHLLFLLTYHLLQVLYDDTTVRRNWDDSTPWHTSTTTTCHRRTMVMTGMTRHNGKFSLFHFYYCAFQKTCQSRNKHKVSAVTCAGHISRTGHSIVLIPFVTCLHISTAGPGTLKFQISLHIPFLQIQPQNPFLDAEFVEIEYVKKFESARPCSRYMQACYKRDQDN